MCVVLNVSILYDICHYIENMIKFSIKKWISICIFDIVVIIGKIVLNCQGRMGTSVRGIQGIGDRLILWLCCLTLAVYNSGSATIVVIGALMTFTISCFGIYIDSKIVRLLLILIYTIVSSDFVVFILFTPVIVYEWLNVVYEFNKDKNESKNENENELFTYKNTYEKNILMCAIPVIVLLISVVNNISQINTIDKLCLSALTFIAIWLNIYCNNYSELKKQFIINRDNSAELTIALKNKNRYLIEKQDNEIYLATLHERNRIAREIHDNVGHMLSRSILQIGAVITINQDETLQPHMRGIKDTLDMAMTSIRTSVHDLHDESIDLYEAVKEIAAKDMKNYEVNIDFDMSNNVPRNIKYCFISVLKESASNINKHSNADKVNISLREHPAFFRLSVEDNGTVSDKIDTINFENKGIGLSNINDRVETFNGTLNINTSKGFRIIISIPKAYTGDDFK